MPWLKCDQQVATPLGGIGQTAQLQGTLVLVAQNVKGSAGAGFAFGDRSVQGGATTQHTLRAQRHGFGHITAVSDTAVHPHVATVADRLHHVGQAR